MNYLGLGVVGRAGARLVSSCKDLYNDLNGANLTGAVDVIAIKQIDGTVKATPFHIRFGKWGVFRTGDLEKEIEIEVNGVLVEKRMMLTESGAAFFVTPNTTESEDVISNKNDSSNGESNNGTSTSTDLDVVLEKNCSEKVGDLEHNGQCNGQPDTGGEELQKLDDLIAEDEDVFIVENKQTEDHEHKKLSLNIMQSSCIEKNVSNPNFYTPTSEMNQLNWEEHIDSGPASLHCDAGALSDSGLVTKPKLYAIGKNDRFLIITYSVLAASEALSDSEVERQHRTQGEITHALSTAEEGRPSNQQQQAGLWVRLTGMLRKKRKRRYSSIEDGIYLDDVDQGYYNEQEIAKYFPPRRQQTSPSTISLLHSESSELTNELTSGIDSSPSLSPSRDISMNESDRIISLLSDISLSQCGFPQEGVSDEAFLNSQISFADFCANPDILAHPDLVVRINNKYYKWQTAGPMIMSCLVYGQTLPDSAQNNLTKTSHITKKASRFWSFWSRTSSNELQPHHVNTTEIPLTNLSSSAPTETSPLEMQLNWSSPAHDMSSDEGLTDEETTSSKSAAASTPRNCRRSFKRKKYNFTTELTSEELLKWPLKMGKNDIIFSITTKIQGTTKAFCSLYLWDYTDKLVISDFDGTITKSDVAGQVLPLIGKDWTHNGVIELFSTINNNGYRFVYLSARAIGQSWYTKNYLRNTCRGERHLPDGPLLVTPFSLYTAFKKEVIERKPEEFKIYCLQQIRSFFPQDYNPFHAGFGNKHSDVMSYQKVDIPSSRIFTVNHKGEIKNHLSVTFQSSYKGLMELAGAQFPPLDEETVPQNNFEKKLHKTLSRQSTQEQFSSFIYWQQSLNDFDKFDLPPL